MAVARCPPRTETNTKRVRERKPNFSAAEINVILEGVRKHKDVILGINGFPSTRKRCFQKITDQVNEVTKVESRGTLQRHWNQIRKKWHDLKFTIVKEHKSRRKKKIDGNEDSIAWRESPVVRQVLEIVSQAENESETDEDDKDCEQREQGRNSHSEERQESEMCKTDSPSSSWRSDSVCPVKVEIPECGMLVKEELPESVDKTVQMKVDSSQDVSRLCTPDAAQQCAFPVCSDQTTADLCEQECDCLITEIDKFKNTLLASGDGDGHLPRSQSQAWRLVTEKVNSCVARPFRWSARQLQCKWLELQNEAVRYQTDRSGHDEKAINPVLLDRVLSLKLHADSGSKLPHSKSYDLAEREHYDSDVLNTEETQNFDTTESKNNTIITDFDSLRTVDADDSIYQIHDSKNSNTDNTQQVKCESDNWHSSSENTLNEKTESELCGFCDRPSKENDVVHKRNRNKNFTRKEIDIILTQYQANYKVLHSRKMDLNTSRKKHLVLQSMVKQLNSPGVANCRRTLHQVKTKLKNMKWEAFKWHRENASNKHNLGFVEEGEECLSLEQPDWNRLLQVMEVMEVEDTEDDDLEYKQGGAPADRSGEKREEQSAVFQKHLDSLVDICRELKALGAEAGALLFDSGTILCCGSDRVKHIATHPLLAQILSDMTHRPAEQDHSAEQWTVRMMSPCHPDSEPHRHASPPVSALCSDSEPHDQPPSPVTASGLDGEPAHPAASPVELTCPSSEPQGLTSSPVLDASCLDSKPHHLVSSTLGASCPESIPHCPPAPSTDCFDIVPVVSSYESAVHCPTSSYMSSTYCPNSDSHCASTLTLPSASCPKSDTHCPTTSTLPSASYPDSETQGPTFPTLPACRNSFNTPVKSEASQETSEHPSTLGSYDGSLDMSVKETHRDVFLTTDVAGSAETAGETVCEPLTLACEEEDGGNMSEDDADSLKDGHLPGDAVLRLDNGFISTSAADAVETKDVDAPNREGAPEAEEPSARSQLPESEPLESGLAADAAPHGKPDSPMASSSTTPCTSLSLSCGTCSATFSQLSLYVLHSQSCGQQKGSGRRWCESDRTGKKEKKGTEASAVNLLADAGNTESQCTQVRGKTDAESTCQPEGGSCTDELSGSPGEDGEPPQEPVRSGVLEEGKQQSQQRAQALAEQDGTQSTGQPLAGGWGEDNTESSPLPDADLARMMDPRPRRHACPFCGRRFLVAAHCQQHIRIHTGEKPFHCDLCGKTFAQGAGLRSHRARHGAERSHTCDLCGRRFYFVCELHSHERRIHGLNVGTKRTKPTADSFTCQECGKVFGSTGSLKNHMTTHTGVKPFACSICQKCFSLRSNLKRHTERHLGLRSFQCEVCGSKFTEKSNLGVHMRYHRDEKPFSCEFCGEAYCTSTQLTSHRRMHTGERPFLCDICGMRFSKGAKLKDHRRTHTGEKPYRCDDCGEVFSNRQQLNVHRRKHTGHQPYTCHICGKVFQKSSHRTVHVRLHTGERPYSCEVCGEKFHRSDVLGLHRKKHATSAPSSSNHSPGRRKPQPARTSHKTNANEGRKVMSRSPRTLAGQRVKSSPVPQSSLCEEDTSGDSGGRGEDEEMPERVVVQLCPGVSVVTSGDDVSDSSASLDTASLEYQFL